ncbi:hypothetical protein Tco_0900488 [Tanacetum coccineum]
MHEIFSPSLMNASREELHCLFIRLGFIADVKEMKDIFEQIEDEVDQCSVAEKFFEIEKKHLLINNDRLLEENIASDIMCTYLRSLNEVDNCGNCKSLDIVLLDIQESNKSLSELRKRFSKLEEYNITLDIAFQNHKEQMILNNPDTKHKQLLVKIINNQSVEINDLKVIRKIKDENVSLAFQEPNFIFVTLFPNSKVIPKVVKKSDLSKSVTSHLTTKKITEKCTKVLALGLLKIETEPINAYIKNNRVVHRDYLRVTKEHATTLQELLEQARSLKPLDEHIGYASKFLTRIQELLMYNSDTICLSCNECLFSANHDACVVQYLKKMQKRKMAKSAKQKVTNEWKPTGRIFKTVGLKWVPTGRMFTLVESKCSSSPSRNTTTKILPNRQIPKNTAVLIDIPYPKLSLRYANAPESLFKCMIHLDFHPFNLHDFGFEGIIRDEELPPWKFDYLRIVEIVLWYLAFGCSKHMTGHRDKLINFVSKFIRTVRFGNDHFAAIMGYGDLQMGNILISRVYYVEGLVHNLFSVGQFCDSDLEVAFRKHTCFVRNLEGDDLLSGSRSSNLYTISMADMMKYSPICLLFKASKMKSWLWPCCISHLNFSTIKKLAKQGLVKGLPMLKYTKDHLRLACQIGKSKKESHPHKLEPSTNENFQMLHMDLCGPGRKYKQEKIYSCHR